MKIMLIIEGGIDHRSKTGFMIQPFGHENQDLEVLGDHGRLEIVTRNNARELKCITNERGEFRFTVQIGDNGCFMLKFSSISTGNEKPIYYYTHKFIARDSLHLDRTKDREKRCFHIILPIIVVK